MVIVNFSPFPNLTTERLLLRQLTLEDDKQIFKLCTNKRVLEFIPHKPHKTISDSHNFINKVNNAISKNEFIIWAITLKNDTKLIGTIGMVLIHKEHYRAETGYLLLPDFYGKGIMQEALKAITDYGFEKMKLHSFEAKVYPNNLASRKLLERSNFIQEGYFKENFNHNGSFLDTVVYSLIRDNNTK